MPLSLKKIFLTERYQVFDQDLIKQFRKEFLTLAKNLKNVTTYEQARELSKYLNNWRNRIGRHLEEIRSNLKSFEYRRGGEDSYYKREAEALQKYMQPVWDFEFELGGMPYNITSPQYNYKTDKHDTWRKGELSGGDREDFRKWEQKLRRKARDAWKWLEDFARFTTKTSEPFKAHFKERENVNLEGFPVQLVGYEDTKTDRERLEKARAGLKTYRSRANRIAPWLLKYQLPIVADFTSRGTRDDAASYENDHINVTVWGLTTTGREFARIMAHEMGHHVDSRVMSKAQQEDWSKFIYGDYKDLDLREVLKKAKPDEKLRDLEKRIEKTDPILKLQIEGLYQHHGVYSLTDIQEHLEAGGDPIVSVPAHPITGYATKNPAEAFCEALGTVVAYGPRSLPPKVRYMLSVLTPVRVWAEAKIPTLKEAYFKEGSAGKFSGLIKNPEEVPYKQAMNELRWTTDGVTYGMVAPRDPEKMKWYYGDIDLSKLHFSVFSPKRAGEYAKTFKQSMEKGEVPPIFVEITWEGEPDFGGEFRTEILDGNHRAMAAGRAGVSHIHGYLGIPEWVSLEEVFANQLKMDEEFIGKKGGLSYFQPGGSLPKGLYNRKNGKPTKDPGVAGLKRKKDQD